MVIFFSVFGREFRLNCLEIVFINNLTWVFKLEEIGNL